MRISALQRFSSRRITTLKPGGGLSRVTNFNPSPATRTGLAIQKRMRFPIKGERSVDLTYRVDAFNLFNRTSFGGIVGTVGNANFGRPTGPQVGARLITMGLRLDF